LQFLNLSKLREYADRFPHTVSQVTKQLILDHKFEAQELPA
jgi:hypothetical protein